MLGEPIFELQPFDVLEVAGIVRHKGGAVSACDGCDEGIFFSCRPARAQQRGTDLTIDPCTSLVERKHLNTCDELVQDRKVLFYALRQEGSAVKFSQHNGAHV